MDQQSQDKLALRQGPMDVDRLPHTATFPDATNPVNNLWQKAWQQAEAKIRKNLKDHLPDLDKSIARPATALEEVLSQAQLKQREYEHKKWTMVSKDGKEVEFRKMYGVVVGYVKKFQIVGDIAIQADAGYASIPWAVIRLFLTTAINEHETRVVMLESMETVPKLLTHYMVIERVYDGETSDSAQAVQESLLNFYIAILNYLVEAINYFDRHSLSRAFRNLDNRVTSLLDSVYEAKHTVDDYAAHANAELERRGLEWLQLTNDRIWNQMEQNKRTEQEARQHFDEIITETQTSLQSLGEQVSDFRADVHNRWNEERAQQILKWVSPITVEPYHAIVQSNRLDSTGVWLLQDPKLTQWMKSSQSSIIWLRGSVGHGKTTLVSIVIDHIKEEMRNMSSPHSLGFFYCVRNEGQMKGQETDGSRSDPKEVLRSIIKQVSAAQSDRGVATIIEQRYEQFRSKIDSRADEPRRLSMGECREIAISLASSRRSFIVIDALDELQPSLRPDLINEIKEISNKCPRPVKILMSTRQIESIESSLSEYPVIDINQHRTSKDVRSFIDHELRQKDWNPEEGTGKKIRDALVKRSQGMFQYASLQMNILFSSKDYVDEEDVLEELKSTPKDLLDLYDKIFSDIERTDGKQYRLTANTLKWLLCSQESLPFPVFLEALRLSINSSKPIPDLRFVHRGFRSLVVQESDTFTFAHLSVQEYLATRKEYTQSECHLMAAESCLRMMLSYYKNKKIDRTFEEPQEAFARYASLYWPTHYQNIDFSTMNDSKRFVRESLKEFMIQGRQRIAGPYLGWIGRVESLIDSMDPSSALAINLRSHTMSAKTPLLAACVFGFPDIIDSLSKAEGYNFNESNGNGQTALFLAIENEHLAVVEKLLGPVQVNRFNVRALEPPYQEGMSGVVCYASALQAAAMRGSKPLFQLLIGKGANPHLVAGYCGSVLQAACLKGNHDIVSLLLEESNVDVNSQGGFHGNALQAACLNGNLPIVQELIEAGACVTAPGGHYGSALMAATFSGNSALIKTLVDEEADINCKSDIYGTPLQRAVAMDRKDLVIDLLGFGADINAHISTAQAAPTSNATSALDKAAWGGQNKMVSLLLSSQAGTDLHHSENAFHILHQAAMCGMTDLTGYCIDRGVNINIATDKGPKYQREQASMTPLSFACAEGHLETVTYLLQNGASVEWLGGHLTALHYAAFRGDERIVKALTAAVTPLKTEGSLCELLDRKTPENKETALFIAVDKSAEVSSILLNLGASLVGRINGVTPLHHAVARNRLESVKVILAHLRRDKDHTKEALNARNLYGKTALVDAAERGYVDIYDLLVKAGADWRIADNDKRSVLHYAAWKHGSKCLEMALQIMEEGDERDKLSLLASTSVDGNRPIGEALARKHFNYVRVLLEHGDTLERSDRARYFFHINESTDLDEVRSVLQCFHGFPEHLRTFLAFRNNPNGHTMLDEAARHKREDIVRLLLAEGADVKLARDVGQRRKSTVLHEAASHSHASIVDLILNHGRKSLLPEDFHQFINETNSFGKTALMDAAERNKREVMALLLNDGADYTIKDKDGHTTLQYCAFRNHKDCVKLLLQFALTHGPEQKFQTLLYHTDKNGISALRDVATQGHASIANILLNDYGTNYEYYYNDSTILHCCCADRKGRKGEHVETLKIILKNMASDPDQEKMKRVLNKRGGHYGGKTAVEVAAGEGFEDMVSLLKSYGAS